jgi:hypothetical protein
MSRNRNRTAPRILTAVNVPDATSLSTIHRTGQQPRHVFLGQQLQPTPASRFAHAVFIDSFLDTPKLASV